MLFGSRAKGTATTSSDWDLDVIQRKVQHLRELTQLLVQRLLHLGVAAASDLLEHLLVQGSGRQPQTYADTFLQAGQDGLISPELAARVAI